jgi:hypothetical protein
VKKLSFVLTGLLLAAVLVLAGAGCSLFGPSVDEVKPGDLDSFEGTPPTTEEEALQTLGMAMGGVGMGVGSDQQLTSDMESALQEADSDFTGFNQVSAQTMAAKLMNSILAQQPEAREITAEGDFEENEQTGSANMSLTITNEKVEGTTGDITINFDGSIEGEGGSDTTRDFFVDVEGTAEGDMVMDNYSNSSTGGYKVDGKVSMAADLDEDVSVVGSKVTVNYDAYFEIAAGLSISGDVGGKFIYSFKIDQKVDNMVIDTAEYGTSGGYEAPEEVELTMSLKIYNNDNEEIKSYEYTEDDSETVAGIFMSMYGGGSTY